MTLKRCIVLTLVACSLSGCRARVPQRAYTPLEKLYQLSDLRVDEARHAIAQRENVMYEVGALAARLDHLRHDCAHTKGFTPEPALQDRMKATMTALEKWRKANQDTDFVDLKPDAATLVAINKILDEAKDETGLVRRQVRQALQTQTSPSS